MNNTANPQINTKDVGLQEKDHKNGKVLFAWSNWWHFILMIVACLIYLWPMIFSGVPIGFWYLNTDVPLQVTGIQKEICTECYVQDSHFNGELRLISEREFIYPALANFAKFSHINIVAISGMIGLLLNLIILYAVFWTLLYQTQSKFWSLLFSTLFIFGFQIFGGVWLGGYIGGYNTHSIAIAFGIIFFGIFLASLKNKNENWIWSIFLITAIFVNLYGPVFMHLLVIMTIYVAWRKTISYKKLLLLCSLCLVLMPVPFYEVYRIYSTGLTSAPDTKILTPYVSAENWEFLLASARRFVGLGIVLVIFLVYKNKSKRVKNNIITNEEQDFKSVLKVLLVITLISTLVSIYLENYSYFFFMFQGTSGFSQYLFLTLFYLVIVNFLQLRFPAKQKIFFGILIYLFLLIFASNVTYDTQHQLDWVKNRNLYHDRIALINYIKENTPKDSIFLTPTDNIAMEIRGFALRSIVIADKDKGGLTHGYEERLKGNQLTERIEKAYETVDVAELLVIANEENANYILYLNMSNKNINLEEVQIIYQNNHYTLLKL